MRTIHDFNPYNPPFQTADDMKKSKNLRRLDATEADTLKTITDWLDLQMAQGKLIYVRHNPSTVISKVVGGKIKTAFKKVRQSQLGAPDLIVLRYVGTEEIGHTDVLCIEAKSAIGKLSPTQERWAEKAVAQGCRHIVARNLEIVQEALK